MPRPGRVTRRRRRFLIAGEGQSEQAFVAWLQEQCDQSEYRVHFEFVSSGGGDGLEVVRLAIRARRKQAHTRRRCDRCLALLDSDRLLEDKRNKRDAVSEARRNGIQAVFVRPNLEGLLVRLHKGQENRQMPSEAAGRELKKLWPEYRKPSTAMELSRRFALNDLIRAAGHDNALEALLQLIGISKASTVKHRSP